jgi:hypothetical protein
MGKRGFICLAVMALVLSACGSSTKTDAMADSITPLGNDTPITAADPYAIPANIDADYINRVMKALMQVRGDVRRDVLRTQRVSPLDYDELDDLYNGNLRYIERQGFSDFSEAAQPEDKTNPGNEVVTVSKVRNVTPGCIAFEAVDNTDALYRTPISPTPYVVMLVQLRAANGHNPTPWKMQVEQPLSTEKTRYECH